VTPERHLQILREQGELLASVPVEALSAPVPTLPDWSVERVVRHVGKVHHWVTGCLRLPDGATMADAPAPAGLPGGPDCLPAYAEVLAEVTSEFAARDPEQPCPTFVGPGTVAWWLRRQAQEVAVHRIDAHDAIHAAGGPAPVPLATDVAADGIDEWATVFLALRFGQRFGELPSQLAGRSLHLHGTDDPPPADGAEWLLRFADPAEAAARPDAPPVVVEHAHAKGDVALRGSAEDLLLVLWRRRPLETVEVLGDRAVAEALLDVARF
jgi:hypothetical protein